MNKISIHTIFLVLIFTLKCIESHSQSSDNKVFNERVLIFTDRMVYVVGEEIHFSAFTFNLDNLDQTELSRIFYIELISAEGKKISKGKYLIEKSAGSGCINIPTDVATGNYFIRAYTKYMRNTGPESYCYIPLKLINPLYYVSLLVDV